jgi:hypothetical protein
MFIYIYIYIYVFIYIRTYIGYPLLLLAVTRKNPYAYMKFLIPAQVSILFHFVSRKLSISSKIEIVFNVICILSDKQEYINVDSDNDTSKYADRNNDRFTEFGI